MRGPPASVTCKRWDCVKLLLLLLLLQFRPSLMKPEKLMSDETCSILFLLCGVVWCGVVLSCCPRWQLKKSRGLAACFDLRGDCLDGYGAELRLSCDRSRAMEEARVIRIVRREVTTSYKCWTANICFWVSFGYQL